MMRDDIPRKKALSYIRYSTLLQGEKGKDSTRRQKTALNSALARWNLELDGEFTDKGKSGYNQKHLATGGAMHRIRDMAIQEKLKGFVLVFEDWDRAGRMQVMDAAPLLMDILNNGCDIVAGQDGGEYLSRDIVNKDKRLLYNALDEMDRGYRESDRKRKLAKSKKEQRLELMKKGWQEAVKSEPMGLNNVPFWIINEWTMIDGKPKTTGNFLFKPFPHYNGGLVKLIKDVFGWYIGGEGGQVIANKLTKMGIPLPSGINGKVRSNGNGWHGTKVHHLIKNRAVMGYYRGTDHKVFPVIIDETTFSRANNSRQERTNHKYAGRKTEHINPYAGLCDCAVCKGAFTRHPSGRKEYVYLQCRSSRQAKCSAAGIPYGRFEESFATFFSHLDTLGLNVSPPSETSKSDSIRIEIDYVEKQIATLKKAMETLPDPSKAVTVVQMVTDCDMKRARLLKDLEAETIRERGTVKVTKGHFDYLKRLFANDNWLRDRPTRLEIQEALRASIDRITIDVKTQSYTVSWKNSPDVFKVELKKGGYKVTGEGCVNLKVTNGDALDFPQDLPEAA